MEATSSRRRWTILVIACALALAPVTALAGNGRSATCNNAFVNLGFETGSFGGWVYTDPNNPFCPIAVVGEGTAGCYGFFGVQPTEGGSLARHGWDGYFAPTVKPQTIVIAQDVTLQDSSSLLMQFDYRAAWTLLPCSQERTFAVEVEPPGGGMALQRTVILAAPGGSTNLDTGDQRAIVDLSPFAGQTVRISFEADVSDLFMGFAQLQIDNVMPLLPRGMTVVGDNFVFEPGETNSIRPSWLNCSSLPTPLTGAIESFLGPEGAGYAILDGAADYQVIEPGLSGDCTVGAGHCYVVSISNPAERPALHWDAILTEQLSGAGRASWPIHVGGSFTDVTAASPFYPFIETLLHEGVTAGCTATGFCPLAPTTRQEMAVFMLTAKEGAGYAPPACPKEPQFTDVPMDSPYCPWIEELTNRGVVAGCGGGEFCPTSPVSREQMAVFVLRTLDPTLNPPPCAPPNMYGDVDETSPFCAWVEELTHRGVVTGCGLVTYCPAASVTREQMGVFISVTFGLSLYGA